MCRVEALLSDATPYEKHTGFTTSEIARRVYGYIEVVDRRHTVAVRRALKSVLERRPDWRWEPWRRTGRNHWLGQKGERVLKPL